MGYKKVCVNCQLSWNINLHDDGQKECLCPECKRPMTILTHRFRPPVKEDKKGWTVVRFLIEHGFPYQHIYDKQPDERSSGITGKTYVSYPTNLPDAKEFIEKYKEQRKLKG